MCGGWCVELRTLLTLNHCTSFMHTMVGLLPHFILRDQFWRCLIHDTHRVCNHQSRIWYVHIKVFWRINTKQKRFTQCWAAGKHVLKCLLSPDSRQMVTTSADKTIKLWNLDGFTLERTLTGAVPYLVIKRPHVSCFLSSIVYCAPLILEKNLRSSLLGSRHHDLCIANSMSDLRWKEQRLMQFSCVFIKSRLQGTRDGCGIVSSQ